MSDTIIAVDFDGTINQFAYPELGEDVPDAFYWMKQFQKAGAKLILYTMRSHQYMRGIDTLQEAIDYCKINGVTFWSINHNPEQSEWTDSPKCHANIFIDDHNAACPMVHVPGKRSYVDWSIVGPWVMNYIEKRKGKNG